MSSKPIIVGGAKAGNTEPTRLRRHDIEVIVDVRSQPYSGHVPHSNRETLARILRERGIVTTTHRVISYTYPSTLRLSLRCAQGFGSGQAQDELRIDDAVGSRLSLTVMRKRESPRTDAG